MVEDVCWVNSTFVLRKEESWNKIGTNKGLGSDECDHDDCQFHLKYYQWTAWVFLVMAIVYYLPR